MDNLKSMFEKGLYQEVADLTEQTDVPDEVLMYAASKVALGEPEKALEMLLSRRVSAYEEKPVAYAKALIKARCAAGQFAEAEQDVKDFQEMPYVSQEMEETLRELPEIIKRETFESMGVSGKPEKKLALDPDGSPEAVMAAMSKAIRDDAIEEEIDGFVAVAERHKHVAVRTFALMQLTAARYHKPIDYRKMGKIYRIVPSDLRLPNDDPEFQRMMEDFDKEAPSPDIGRFASGFFGTYLYMLFPEDGFKDIDVRETEAAFMILAKETLKDEKTDLTPFMDRYHVDEERAKRRALEIREVLGRVEE